MALRPATPGPGPGIAWAACQWAAVPTSHAEQRVRHRGTSQVAMLVSVHPSRATRIQGLAPTRQERKIERKGRPTPPAAAAVAVMTR